MSLSLSAGTDGASRPPDARACSAARGTDRGPLPGQGSATRPPGLGTDGDESEREGDRDRKRENKRKAGFWPSGRTARPPVRMDARRWRRGARAPGAPASAHQPVRPRTRGGTGMSPSTQDHMPPVGAPHARGAPRPKVGTRLAVRTEPERSLSSQPGGAAGRGRPARVLTGNAQRIGECRARVPPERADMPR